MYVYVCYIYIYVYIYIYDMCVCLEARASCIAVVPYDRYVDCIFTSRAITS